MVMSNKVYDFLKNVSLVIPILATLYFALAPIWGWPYADAVAGSASAVETALLSLLKISSVKYNKEKQKEAERESFEKTLQ